MILSSLVRMAERQGLMTARGFDDKPVHWIIDIEEHGRVLGVTSTASRPDGAKKDVFRSLSIPVRCGRTVGVVADLLVDNAQYFFGIGDPQRPFKEDRVREAVEASQASIAPLCALDPVVAAQLKGMQWIAGNLPAFAALWNAGSSGQVVPSLAGDLTIPKAWASNHLFAFRVNDQFVTAMAAVRSWVSERAAGGGGSTSIDEELCLVTGRWSPIKRLIDGVNIPGDTGSVPLVSFNQPSFWHYGRENNENAPVSIDAADAVFTAMNHLLKPGNGRSYRLSGDTSVLFWSDTPSGVMDPVEDLLLGPCLEGDPAAVKQVEAVYSSPRSGRPVLIADQTPFCTLVLTRVKKRVTVRSATLATISDVAKAMKRWLDDLSISGAGDRPYRSIGNLCRATVSTKSTDSDPAPDLATRLYQAAVLGTAIPSDAMAAIIRRIRAHDDAGASPSRIALIKATLIRSFHQEVPVSLAPDHPAPAYHLGRLFAVLEVIQDKAINANAGIAERFLGAAMGTPALVFPRLLKLHHHHLAKIDGGLAMYFGKMIDGIVARLPPELPRTQALVDQGTFMVGYHHQRTLLFTKKSDDAKESA